MILDPISFHLRNSIDQHNMDGDRYYVVDINCELSRTWQSTC